MRYKIIRSDRQTVGLEVEAGKVLVRAPRKMRKKEIKEFVKENKKWIRQKLKEFPKRRKGRALSKRDIAELTEQARATIPSRVQYYAARIGVDYNRITIRHQKTRWGSCSGKRNLNFNCLLLLAPVEIMDSVIIHELCHLKHMNHSRDFYNELYRICPNYDYYDQWLKKNGKDIIRRMTR